MGWWWVVFFVFFFLGGGVLVGRSWIVRRSFSWICFGQLGGIMTLMIEDI